MMSCIGMVRFSSVQFFEEFWRTENKTIDLVHKPQQTLDQTIGLVQNSQILVLRMQRMMLSN